MQPTIMPGVRNSNQTPLYDTKIIAAGATGAKIQFFAQTRAANNIETTNLRRANQLEQGERFTVFGMGFEVVEPAQADLRDLYKKFAASLIVSGKERLVAPISHFPAGGGAHAAAATTATTTTIYSATNGVPSAGAVQSLAPEYAIGIDGGQIFSVELNGTSFTASAELFIRCYLFGVYESLVS